MKILGRQHLVATGVGLVAVAAVGFLGGCQSFKLLPGQHIHQGTLYDESELFARLAEPAAKRKVSSYKSIQQYVVVNKAFASSSFPGYPGLNIQKKEGLLLMRSLRLDGVPSYVFVRLSNGHVGLAKAAEIDRRTTKTRASKVAGHPYAKALRRHRTRALRGIDGSHLSGGESIAITVDMCPARNRSWDKKFFQRIVDLGKARGKPLTLGVAITGGWVKGHHSQFRQLLAWNRSGAINIQFINHSYNHPVRCRGRKCKFMTAPGIDTKSEILRVERLLLSQDAIFTSLFRFPGLVYNNSLLNVVNKLSLIALDTNNWRAKDRPARNGDLILVHGNTNEPAGIKKILRDLDKLESKILSGKLDLVSPLKAIPRG